MDRYVLDADADKRSPDLESERELLVLLLDASGSMGEVAEGGQTRIDQLNQAMQQFLAKDIHKLVDLENRGEIAIGVFNQDEVSWQELGTASEHPFYFVNSVTSFNPISATGNTPLAKAVGEAISCLATRKDALRKRKIIYNHRPNVFLITDGRPSDNWQDLPRVLRAQEEARKLLFWALGTHDAHDGVLTQIAGRNAYYALRGVSMANVISFVSSSIGQVSSMDADRPAQEYYDMVMETAERVLREHNDRLG